MLERPHQHDCSLWVESQNFVLNVKLADNIVLEVSDEVQADSYQQLPVPALPHRTQPIDNIVHHSD